MPMDFSLNITIPRYFGTTYVEAIEELDARCTLFVTCLFRSAFLFFKVKNVFICTVIQFIIYGTGN